MSVEAVPEDSQTWGVSKYFNSANGKYMSLDAIRFLTAGAKEQWPRISGAIEKSWCNALCPLSVLARAVLMSSYLRKYLCVLSPKQTFSQSIGEWTRRDSNPHLPLRHSAVFPLHHGPEWS